MTCRLCPGRGRARLRLLLLALVLPPGLASAAPGAARVTALRVEYLTNPVGIDVPRPRFSWVVESPERGTRQVAYQILVASSPQRLAKGEGDVWDSGKVDSAANAQIAYDGSELLARERYHVTVRVWDDWGRQLRPAEPAFFEMGVLDFASWRGRFIGLPAVAEEDRMPFAGGKWIWAAEPRPGLQAKRAAFRAAFVLAEDERVRWAELVVAGTAAPEAMEGPPPAAPGRIWLNRLPLREWSAPVSDPRWLRVPIERLHAGANELAFLLPYSARGALTAALRLELADGRVRVVRSDESWRHRLLEAAAADDAEDAWLARGGDELWKPVESRGPFGETIDMQEPGFRRIDKVVPPLYLRKAFTLKKPVARARLYATAAGVYEAYLNGKRVGGDPLAPGFTDYARRLRYQTYDVTALCAGGRNALGAIVGDGWYSGRTGLGQNVWGFDKAFFAELHVDYKDGSREVILTDETWRGATGPERRADLLDGVVYDARREHKGWSEAGFADGKWAATVVLTPRVGRFEAPAEPPVRALDTLAARAVTSPTAGVQIFDLGQNIVGRPRVKLTAPAGTAVTLRYGETLDKDGTLFVDNLRTANATDRYFARGGASETFEPRFTLHGFRYVEVSGLPKPLPLSAVSGVVIASDLPVVGRLQTSSPLLDRLHANLVWAARGSFVAAPMVGPAGDGRLGWGAEVAGFARSAAFDLDLAAFYAKYAQDLQDGQLADGRFPDAAPGARRGSAGTPGWADAGVLVPALLRELYGDARVLARQYDGMKKWVDARERAPRIGDARALGDPGAVGAQPALGLVAQAHHALTARLLSAAAAVLGKADDAAAYAAMAGKAAAAFRERFVAADGALVSDTAAAYALALRHELLPESDRGASLAHLVAALERAGKRPTTGVLGTPHLLPALTAGGRGNLAAALVLAESAPSWLATVKQGATTPWERWDAVAADGPAKSPPCAYNHLALAGVGEWLYAGLAGLDHDRKAPPWSRILIRPLVGAGGLTHVRGEHGSIRGKVVSAWKLERGGLTLEVEIPVHATALVHVPAASADLVKEGGHPVADAAGVRVAETRDGIVVLELASGRYRFSAPAP